MGKFKSCKKKWEDGKAIGGNKKTISKPSGENNLWRKLEDFKRRNVLAKDKSYYSQ
jgi:hypothetical protein